MSRVSADNLPIEYNRGTLTDTLRGICSQLNGLSEGRIVNRHSALTAAPTTGNYAQGDMVWNSAPSEAGSVSSKYVVLGWVCTVSGTPGTFVQMRVLTGN